MMLFTWLQYATQGGAELGGQIRRGIAAPGTAGQRNQSSGGGADHGRAAGFQRKCRVYFAGSLQTDQHLVYNGSQLAATCVGIFGQSGLLAKVDGQQPLGAHPLGGNLLQIVHQLVF